MRIVDCGLRSGSARALGHLRRLAEDFFVGRCRAVASAKEDGDGGLGVDPIP
jgi:hypothetical protein